MKNTLIAVCALIAALIAVEPAFADGKAKSHKEAKEAKPRGVVVHARAPATAKPSAVVKTSPPKQPWVGHNVAIAPCERHVIRAYVFGRVEASKGGRFNGVPQGLAKKVAWSWGGGLPTGWQKTCVRGEVLPVEVHKHCQALPYDIVVKLPPPPPGTVLLAVDGTVIRVGYPTYEVLDVFEVL